MLCVGHAALDHGVYHCEHVPQLPAAHVVEDGVREGRAASCAPPRIGQQDHVPSTGEYLRPVAPRGAELVRPQRRGPTVNLYYEWAPLSVTATVRLDKQPL